MRFSGLVIVMLLAGILTACGGSGEPSAESQGIAAPGGNKPPPSGDASAEEVAREARGDLRCPAKVTTPARDPAAPVDDVVGVRPGMTFGEAANVVLCTNDMLVLNANNGRGFRIQTYGQVIRQGFDARFAEPRIQKTSKQIMQEMQDNAMARSGNAVRRDMKPGQAKWNVTTMGMPGQETVINAAREEWFEEGRNPTKASIEQALVSKYGTVTKKQDTAGNIYLTWAHDPFARLITETSPLYNRCSGNAAPDGGINLSPDCGTVVMAIIHQMRENPDLAQYFQVGVVDQAGGYERLTATEQGLQQMENDRRAKEVEEASRNATAPTL